MGTEPVFNVGTDYGGNIQAALDAVSASQAFLARGGTVYVPRGQYVVTNPLLVRGGRIILRGENLDTLIHPSIDNQPVVKLEGNNSAGYGVHDFKMETLQIIGLSQRSGNIGLYCKGEGGYFPSGLRFENVFISDCQEGLYFENIDFPMFRRFGISNCLSNGATFKVVSQIAFYHSFIQVNGGYGIKVEDALGFYYQGPGVQNNGYGGPTVGGQSHPNTGAWQMHIKNSWSVVVTRSDIEEFVNGILIEGCRGVSITGNVFLPAPHLRGRQVTGILLRKEASSAEQPTGGVSSGVEITGNTFFGGEDNTGNYPTTTGVKIEKDSTRDLYLAGNGPASRGPARLIMYDYPTGQDAEGMNSTVIGPHTGDGFEAQKSQKGIRLASLTDAESKVIDSSLHGFLAFHGPTKRLMLNIDGRWRRATTEIDLPDEIRVRDKARRDAPEPEAL